MTAFLRILLLALLAVAVPAVAQDAGGSSAYAIGGIQVDVVAKTTDEARMAAYRIAQRKAWPLLWARMTGQAANSAPRLSDGQLDQIVAGIESQGEHFSLTRYIARLGVVFDRSRAAEYFGGTQGELHSPPMLLLPVFADAGVRTVYQARTPWRAAWQRWKEQVTPIDYVLASGSAGDNVLLTAYQVTRPDRTGWRNILNRFDAVDVLTAEARLRRGWPGGPVDGVFIARHGPDATELGRFELRASAEAGLDAMLDEAVRKIDEIYAEALRDGRLKSEADLSADLAPLLSAAPVIGSEGVAALATGAGAVEVDAATLDPAAVNAIESQLRATPTVTSVTITSLSIGGSSRLVIGYGDSYEMLLFHLDQKGWRIASENGVTVLRRRREGETPLLRPASSAQAATAEVIAEPDAAGIAPPQPQPRNREPAPATGPIDLTPPARPGRAARASPASPPPPPQQGPIDLLAPKR